MAGNIDWALATQQPNYLNNYLTSFQAGRAMGKQNAIQNALADYATDPDTAIAKYAAIDPVGSAQLQQAHIQAQEAALKMEQLKTRKTAGALLAKAYSGGQPSTSPAAGAPSADASQGDGYVPIDNALAGPPASAAPSAGATSTPAPAAAPATSSSASPTSLDSALAMPQAYAPKFDMDAIRQADQVALQGGDWEMHAHLAQFTKDANDQSLNAARVRADAMAKVATDAAGISAPDQDPTKPETPATLALRRQYIQGKAGYLQAATGGTVTPQMLQQIPDPTSTWLSGIVGLPQTLEQHIAYTNQQGTADSNAQRQAETVRHNKAEEGIGRSNAGSNAVRASAAAQTASTYKTIAGQAMGGGGVQPAAGGRSYGSSLPPGVTLDPPGAN